VPAQIETEEMVNAGLTGLFDAARRFDSSRGAHFITFAHWRIRGAVVDWLREQDYAPRRLRHLGNVPRKLSLDEPVPPQGVPFVRGHEASIDDRDWWQATLRRLSPFQRKVVDAYFREELTFREIGRRLGVSESYCCMVTTQVKARLRAVLAGERRDSS